MTRGTTRAHIARAALEAMAYQCAEVLSAMSADSGLAVEQLKVDGGASVNNLLMQMQSDLCGVPVHRPRMTEATAAGAAFLAGVAVGLWQASDPPSAFGELDRVFEPSMSVDEREQRMAQWQRAVQRSLGWSQSQKICAAHKNC